MVCAHWRSFGLPDLRRKVGCYVKGVERFYGRVVGAGVAGMEGVVSQQYLVGCPS